MARYAIDAPTLLHLVDERASGHASHQLVAPNSIRSEALQLLLREVRDGQRSEAEASACHEKLTQLKMRLLGDRVSRRTAWKLAIEHDWDDLSAAEYLVVCSLQADALVTVDPAMATRARGIVPVAPVSALLG